MKVQSINSQTFGNSKLHKICKEYPETFYTLSADDKLDVLYGMLKEQKKDLVTLSINQSKIQSCNDNASMIILKNLRDNGEIFDASLLGKSFDSNRINIIA